MTINTQSVNLLSQMVTAVMVSNADLFKSIYASPTATASVTAKMAAMMYPAPASSTDMAATTKLAAAPLVPRPKASTGSTHGDSVLEALLVVGMVAAVFGVVVKKVMANRRSEYLPVNHMELTQ